MQRTDISNFLQGLQGVQPVVVLAFLAIRTALSLDDLQIATGKDSDAITRAVKGLEGKGFLVRQVGAHGKRYWLPASASFFGVLGQTPLKAESGAVVDVVNQLDLNLSTISTTTTTYSPQTPLKAESGKEKVISRISTHKSEAEIAECLAVLKELGIHGRKAEHLALYDWVSPEYIRAQVLAAGAVKGQWDNPLGMAIYLMEQKFPVTELRENGHALGCKCAECVTADFFGKGNRYSRSSFNLGSAPDPACDPDDEELNP